MVPSSTRHAASLLKWAATRRAQERDGAEALDELAWSDRAVGAELPPGLTLRWLGTAGFELAYEGFHLLIDPYVTRVGLGDLLRRRTVAPDAALVATEVPRADAVLVGHTHFDHVLDVPEIVRRHGCPAYGSASVATLLDLYGLRDRAVTVEPHRTYELGPFEVRFVPSLHSKLALGRFVPQSGPLTCDHVDKLCPQAYRCDQVWGIHIGVGGTSLYHQGSADLVDEELEGLDVDVFLCGIAGRQFSPAYVERVLRLLDPQVVLPCHHDDFFRRLDQPMGFTVDVDVAGFVAEVARVSADVSVRTLRLGQSVAAPVRRGTP
jgi:L-ascorbate metabolism protein UlaG (beta-lactamase superfamily)